ncbi:hypothetical protein BC938DRAFT_475443 [Jimgerdemannia flammicorona]|uniref:GST N-terminal domain-containing protein n=1 Tax=Jimgerdemannia flammicorona TaxID=994334 RepID=A0A433PUR9_9FUNG|nr:hypothetical protein BC938DRAFT_475443 [Jimgerdemannia flammicorona]
MSQTQPPIVLFHYSHSPYSKKIIWALHLKGLPYHSVNVAPLLPRPDVEKFAHGYRKIPVMAIGADVYCDTKRMLQELEDRFPEPSLYPPRAGTTDKVDRGVTDVIAYWTDVSASIMPKLDRPFAIIKYFPILPLILLQGKMFPLVGALIPWTSPLFSHPRLINDRAQLIGRQELNTSKAIAAQPFVKDQLLPHLHTIESQLRDGRTWMLDTTVPGAADIHVAMELWFAEMLGQAATDGNSPGGARDIWNAAAFPLTFAWYARFVKYTAERKVAVTKITGDEALELARAHPLREAKGATGLFKLGQRVAIVPDDYGKVPTRGALVKLDETEIVVRNEDGPVPVHIHFSKIGYVVTPEAKL